MKQKLIKLAVIFTSIVVLGTGCGRNNPEEGERFVTVERGFRYEVVYDVNTRVLYVVSNGMNNSGTYNILVDSDGKPLLYEE